MTHFPAFEYRKRRRKKEKKQQQHGISVCLQTKSLSVVCYVKLAHKRNSTTEKRCSQQKGRLQKRRMQRAKYGKHGKRENQTITFDTQTFITGLFISPVCLAFLVFFFRCSLLSITLSVEVSENVVAIVFSFHCKDNNTTFLPKTIFFCPILFFY